MYPHSEKPIIVSACLTGMKCVNYPSFSLEDEVIKQLFAQGRAIPLCPEQIGGLPTPRPPAGFQGGNAVGFWAGSGGNLVRIVSTEGDDYTEQFLSGAYEILRLAQLVGAEKAILHDGSPSCGVTRTSVYNEHGLLTWEAGCGVLTWLLQANNITVYSSETWKEACP